MTLNHRSIAVRARNIAAAPNYQHARLREDVAKDEMYDLVDRIAFFVEFRGACGCPGTNFKTAQRIRRAFGKRKR